MTRFVLVVLASSLFVGCDGGDKKPFNPNVEVDPNGLDLPDNSYCNKVMAWPSESYKLELEAIQIVNHFRSKGYKCASGDKPPAPPVKLDAGLMCAARYHSLDMANQNYFSHMSKNGDSFSKRVEKAGGGARAMGENIAAGNSTADKTVDQWLNSKSGHCNNLMNPNATLMGIGFAEDPGAQFRTRWTQVMGR